MLRRLNWLGMPVPTYLVLAVLGIFVAFGFGLWWAGFLRVPRIRFGITFALALVCGIAGSRVWVLYFEGPALELEWRAAFLWPWLPGQSALCGLFGGLVGIGLASLLLRRRVGELSDLLAAPAAAGLAIGRLGCLGAGCCYGKPTLFPVALVYWDFDAPTRPLGVPLHATPIYLGLLHLILLALMLARAQPRRFKGELTLLYLTGYSAMRLAVESLRADWRGELLGWPLPMVVLAGAFPALAVTWAFRKKGEPPR